MGPRHADSARRRSLLRRGVLALCLSCTACQPSHSSGRDAGAAPASVAPPQTVAACAAHAETDHDHFTELLGPCLEKLSVPKLLAGLRWQHRVPEITDAVLSRVMVQLGRPRLPLFSPAETSLLIQALDAPELARFQRDLLHIVAMDRETRGALKRRAQSQSDGLSTQIAIETMDSDSEMKDAVWRAFVAQRQTGVASGGVREAVLGRAGLFTEEIRDLVHADRRARVVDAGLLALYGTITDTVGMRELVSWSRDAESAVSTAAIAALTRRFLETTSDPIEELLRLTRDHQKELADAAAVGVLTHLHVPNLWPPLPESASAGISAFLFARLVATGDEQELPLLNRFADGASPTEVEQLIRWVHRARADSPPVVFLGVLAVAARTSLAARAELKSWLFSRDVARVGVALDAVDSAASPFVLERDLPWVDRALQRWLRGMTPARLSDEAWARLAERVLWYFGHLTGRTFDSAAQTMGIIPGFCGTNFKANPFAAVNRNRALFGEAPRIPEPEPDLVIPPMPRPGPARLPDEAEVRARRVRRAQTLWTDIRGLLAYAREHPDLEAENPNVVRGTAADQWGAALLEQRTP